MQNPKLLDCETQAHLALAQLIKSRDAIKAISADMIGSDALLAALATGRLLKAINELDKAVAVLNGKP